MLWLWLLLHIIIRRDSSNVELNMILPLVAGSKANEAAYLCVLWAWQFLSEPSQVMNPPILFLAMVTCLYFIFSTFLTRPFHVFNLTLFTFGNACCSCFPFPLFSSINLFLYFTTLFLKEHSFNAVKHTGTQTQLWFYKNYECMQ